MCEYESEYVCEVGMEVRVEGVREKEVRRARIYKIVVLPALSSPKMSILTSLLPNSL
jgi:hypothetical protein